MAAILPIASLDPDSTPPPDKSIRAVVSLYWPYSSSTEQCALLLSDPDPRLRSRRGQVRVRFTAASATAVAQGRVGIGDEVLLDLRGVRWASDGTRVATPGKSVEDELVYKGELSLRIVKKAGSSKTTDQHLTVDVSTPPPDEDYDAHQTPARNTRVANLRNSQGAVDLVPIYSSPAFVRRQRLSGDGFVKEAVYDPFADIDQELENKQPRKRQRISDVSSWRFAGRSPSPEKQRPAQGRNEVVGTLQSTTSSRQEEAQATVVQIRKQAADPMDGLAVDVDQDTELVEEMQLAQDTTDTSREIQSLPVKLSPLPPPIPNLSSRDRDQPPADITMLPPPLLRLQMPDDPFVSQPDETRSISQLELQRPSTPELKAVPASALPLPSPFPEETEKLPLKSPIATARDEPETTATRPRPSSQHKADLDDASDDGVRLQVNPTITALAKQHKQATTASESGSTRTLEKALRDPASQQPNSSTDGGSNDAVRGYSSQATTRYTFSRPRTAASQTEVYPEPRESGSDTEEDEVMHKAYSQQIQSRARDVLAREGIKARDWVHRGESAEFIQQTGIVPESSAETDEAGGSNGASDDDDGMLSIHEQDVQHTFVQEPEAMSATESANLTVHTEEVPADQDELMIDVRSRLLPAHRQTASQSPAEDDRRAAPLASPKKEPRSQQPTATILDRSRTDADTLETPQVATMPKPTISQNVQRVPPKTPAKTLQSLFGFNYSMDGANDTPASVQSTPQSEKDRIMKKTYSSLFGFRASPSPEKQEAPSQQALETPTPFDSVQREDAGVAAEQAQSSTVPAEHSQVVIAANHNEPRADDDSSNRRLSRQGSIKVDEAGMATDVENLTSSTDARTAVRASLESANDQSLGQREDTTSEQQDQVTAATHDIFGSLEVQLSEMSDDESDVQGESAPTTVPPDALREKTTQTTQPSLMTAATTQQRSVPPVAQTTDEAPEVDASSATPALPEPEVELPEREHAPFDDEAFVASMLNDATSLPGSPESVRGETPRGNRRQPMATSPAASAWTSPAKAVANARSAPASTAPERFLSSQKVQIPPPSTAPRTSQIGVIDLGSSNVSSDDEEPDQPITNLALSQPANSAMDFQRDITADDEDPDGRTYSPTEVASSPAAPEAADIDMQDVDSEDDAPLVDASDQGDLQILDADISMSDAQHEDLPADTAEAETPRGQPSVLSGLPPQSQISEAPSTQSKNIADRYRYFSFQSNESESLSSDDDEGEIVDTLGSAEPVLQSDTRDASRTVSKEEGNQRPTASIARQSQVDITDTEVSPGQAITQTTKAVLEVPVEASPSTKDAKDEVGQIEIQQSSRTELPSPEHSQPQLQVQVGETQHRVESQPFETQIPSAEPAVPALLPTPAVTNEGLKVAVDVDTPAQAPASATPKRMHKRNSSSKDSVAPVRRSPRKAEPQSQQEGESLASNIGRTRNQRTASPEVAQVTAVRQTRSQRTATPEAAQSTTASFDSNLLTPQPPKPLRRSPRKSQAAGESFDGIVEERDGEAASSEIPEQSQERDSRVREAQPQPLPEVSRVSTEEVDISPPPKRSSSLRSSQRDQQAERNTPLPKPAELSSRKSFTSRLGHVPEVISSWFSPRRSSRQQQQTELETTFIDDTINEKAEILQRTTSNGIVTSSAYYTPLSNLDEKLNAASQPGVDNTIDVLAVVTDDTKTPERAKGGPRDYFTILKLVDPSTSKSKSNPTRVEVFRPWHATLPVARAGDVVLLRSFAVKSRKRQPYLLSTDASAWLVWKFEEAESGAGKQRPGSSSVVSPRRTRRGSLIGAGAREEVKGPPVELGDEERQRARELSAWWQGLSSKKEE
ncbi:putative telomeric single stranded DNA binding POT1/Cdc13, nucleic acid-binding protein [Septoria linicola]|nr:putative telomeric single stranded DNA binding POT1/Cdc13, nucleic acid-binding protein [Septoria linicola]